MEYRTITSKATLAGVIKASADIQNIACLKAVLAANVVPADALAVSMDIKADASLVRMNYPAVGHTGIEIRHSSSDYIFTIAQLTPTALPQSLDAEPGTAFTRVEMDGIPYSEVSNEFGTTVNIGG